MVLEKTQHDEETGFEGIRLRHTVGRAVVGGRSDGWMDLCRFQRCSLYVYDIIAVQNVT